MRLWADYIEQNVKHHLLPLAVKNPDTLRELAAQWEADLSARDHAVDLAGINAEAANELERRAERAEAALEQIQDVLSVRDHQYLAVQAQIVALRAGFAMYSKIDGDDGLASANRLLAACERGDGIDQHAAPDIMAARAEIVAQRAALERARALWIRWRDTLCLFPQLEKFVEAADAALASGGAA